MVPSPERIPADHPARHRLRTEFDTTFFVEAGAGTGKTAAIVGRIAALVAAGRLVSPRLVAITFTEAAAAELRARVKERLEQATSDPAFDPEEQRRCQLAARQLDQASIDTIHAFARTLLGMFPLEAGLPPNFETLDEIEETLDFEDRFRKWFDDLAGNPQRREAARRVLLLGMMPDQIARLAWGVQNHYDLLARDTDWPVSPAPPATPIAHDLARMIVDARDYLPYGPADHPFARVLLGLQFAAERLEGARTEDEALMALQSVEKISFSHGSQTEWRDINGQNAGRLLKEALKEVETGAREALESHRQASFCSLLPAVRDFVLDYADERKRLGVTTFDDLLTWARDLLRDHPDVRARAQARWDRIFLDEFQDTDPLQIELALYLAGDPRAPLSKDWRQTPLVQGKLCLVGDPKQSIYRFRRADIALYQVVQQHVGETLNLTENFRSVPQILEWVNHHYGRVMRRVEGAQPEYIALNAHEEGTSQAVYFVGHPLDAPQREVWEAEARAVAECSRRVVDEAWMVSEGRSGSRTMRKARFRDICVLIPSRTNLKRLERAFDRESVPYRLESGELIILTQEVRDLISCLRAIEDPSDQVALVAALRAPIYGCSDPELLQWVETNGRLDHERPGTGQGDRVSQALTHLADFHRRRHEMSAAGLVEAFVDSRLLIAASFGQPRPREVWRRYRYVAGRARAFAATGRTNLRAFVEWMEGLELEQARDVGGSLSEVDEDAVRVLTIHGAKGLEFPVVIMTGWGSKRSFRAPAAVPDRIGGRLALGIGDFATADYQDAIQHERALDEAEALRLTYVAATRARDHLILSLFRRANAQEVHATAFALNLEGWGRAESIQLAGPSMRDRPAAITLPSISVEEHKQAEAEWIAHRQAALDARRGLRIQTPTGLSHAADKDELAAQDEPSAYRRGRAGTSLGRAVHAVLQTIDLATLDGLDDLARIAASVEGAADRVSEVARLVTAAATSQPVRRALSSARYWREVPIGANLDGVLLEGVIDLLYEENGKFVVVDYKTDRLSPSDLEKRKLTYRLQGAAYALLVEAATKGVVEDVSFVFAATNSVWRIEDLDQAKAHAMVGLSSAS
jgi:ATP-dependent helicase/nuclease subunit A